MTEALRELARPLVQLAALRPGLFMMLAGLAVLGVKVWRHASRRTKYDLRQFYKYPDDALLTGGAALMFLAGLLRMILE